MPGSLKCLIGKLSSVVQVIRLSRAQYISCKIPKLYIWRFPILQERTIIDYLEYRVYTLILDIPPSTCSTCPVIQLDFSESRKVAVWAMSSALPIRFSGCRSALAFNFCSVLSNLSAKGVCVRDGAMALTRIWGANSAASDRVSPSMAPFEAAT